MPIDPKNISGPEKNTVPFFRNDTVPQSAKPNKPATMDRQEAWKNDPHYSGDNAREIIYPDTTPYGDNKYMKVDGVLDVGVDSAIWSYSDSDIENALRIKVAAKFNMSPKYIKVLIDRALGKIRYVRSMYVQAKKEEIILTEFKRIRNGEEFKFSDEAYEEYKKYSIGFDVPKDKIWVKINDSTAQTKDGKFKFSKILPWSKFILVEDIPYDKKAQAQAIPFRELPIDALFVFKNMPKDILEKWNPTKQEKEQKFAYDQKFKKISESKAQAGDKTINIRNLNQEVYPDEEWKAKHEYKKEPMEEALNRIVDSGKVEKTKWGEMINIPKENFLKEVLKYGVSEAMLNSRSKTHKDTGLWIGSYNGKRNNFDWSQKKGSDEVELTRS